MILKALYWIIIIALACAALCMSEWQTVRPCFDFRFTDLCGADIGDVQRDLYHGIEYDPMFIPPQYQEIEKAEYPPKPKWTSLELHEKELQINKKIAELESDWYHLGFHKLDKDESFYRGGKNSAGEREGVGRVDLPTGDMYIGEWEKNLRHGVGGMIFAGGDQYECEWAFGEPHGFGTFRSMEGHHYTGEFIAGHPNGYGRLKAEGTVYAGQFVEGAMHGYGIWSDGKTQYIGDFVNGSRHGIGNLTRLDNGAVLFAGEFKNGQAIRGGWQPKSKRTPTTAITDDSQINSMESEIIREEQEQQEPPMATISLSGGL